MSVTGVLDGYHADRHALHSTDQGYLRLEIIRAANLRAADRGKSSDPYVVFKLNGERKGKTKTIKKTLNPEFNEDLGEVPVASRVAADALLEVYDWDQVGTADHLGEAQLNLAELEPFEQVEKTLAVSGKGCGDGQPTITVRMVFKPDFVTHRERKGTSIARTMTSGIGGVAKVGGAGVKGVAGAGMFVGKTAFGVPKGAVNLISGRGRKKSTAAEDGSEDAAAAFDGLPPVPAMPAFTADGTAVPNSLAPNTPAGPSSMFSHAQSPSAGDDAASALDSPTSKRKSRIHNPFKRH